MEIDENGVVNPLRAPAFVRDALRSVGPLPPVALAFVVVAGVDLLARTIEVQRFSPIFVARAMAILWPAALLWRRPDAAAVTPQLFKGVVLLAVAEIAATSVSLVSSAIPVDVAFFDDPTGGWPRFVVGAVLGLVPVLGWALIGTGVASLRPTRGTGMRAVAALVAGCAVIAGAGFAFVDLQASDAATSPVLFLVVALGAASWIVTAYVGWVLVSRAGGLPRRATIAAAAGVVIQILGWLPLAVTSLAILATRSDDWIAFQANAFASLSTALLVAAVLFVLAFATGLGDPPAEPIEGPEGATA